MRSKQEILDLIEDEDIEFIRLQFTDPLGNLKNVAVTSRKLEKVLDNQYAFENEKIFKIYEDELYLRPDLNTFAILPWRPQQSRVARFICDVCDGDGNEISFSPRTILKNTIKNAKDKGYDFYINPECEFFLFHTDENGQPTTLSHEHAGLMDVGPVDLGENARRNMVLMLEEMGFNINSSYHESASAQHEIDFEEGTPLSMADDLITFKSSVRSVAKTFGLHATFMPKPLQDQAGSGMHLNLSVYKDDRNILKDYADGKKDNPGAWFAGGVMKYAGEMCAVTNPIVNSYKREFNNIPKLHSRKGEDVKLEFSFADPSANPYLAFALFINAGLRGIDEKLVPDEALCNGALPSNLLEAVKLFKKSKLATDTFGEDFAEKYAVAKENEWNEYMSQVSDWELQKYLYRI